IGIHDGFLITLPLSRRRRAATPRRFQRNDHRDGRMCGVTNQDVLRELADAHGVATRYTASDGEEITVTDDTLLKTLRALGVALSDAPDGAELRAALDAHRTAEA